MGFASRVLRLSIRLSRPHPSHAATAGKYNSARKVSSVPGLTEGKSFSFALKTGGKPGDQVSLCLPNGAE